MNHFALDASALVKRYHNEPGAKVVQTLTDTLLADEPRHALVSWSTLAERLAWIEAHVCLLLETADEGRDLAFHEPRPGYETETPVPSDTESPDSQG